MKSLKLRVSVQSNKTAGTEGQPALSERLTFTPLVEAEENQTVFKGPAGGSSYQPYTQVVDNPESFGIFDGATEALIEITPVAPKRAAAPRKQAKPAKAAKVAKAKPAPVTRTKPPRARQMPSGRKSGRHFLSVKH